MWSAYNWTFIVICATVMYHYFLLFYYPKTYDPMIRFYLGWCCGSNLSRCDEIKFYATKVVMGIISPYLTILYNNILMPATLHQISTNRKKIVTIRETLTSNSTLHDNLFFPLYPIKDKQNHFCTQCEHCTSQKCFCQFCGFFNDNRSKTPTSKEYQAEIKKID